MRIEYIFIENYKEILRNLDINFGSERIYSYIGNGKIRYELNNRYIDNMYEEYTSIENISAIVGKNGVGKTTLLRAINEIFRKGTLLKFIIIYCINKKIYLYSNLSKRIQLDDMNIKVIENKKGSYILDGGNPANIIYFSSIFDKARKLNSNKLLLDISTNQMVRQLQLDKILLKRNENYESITELRRREIPNVLLLLNDLKQNKLRNVNLLFETPEYIEIRVENNIGIYKYNVNKIRAEDFHDIEMITKYGNIINIIYDLFCRKHPKSYRSQFYVEYLLNQPITMFINADIAYNISIVKEIEILFNNFENIPNKLSECSKSLDSILVIESSIIEFNYNIYRVTKRQRAEKEKQYINIEYDDKTSLYNLIFNITGIIDNILNRYTEDEFDNLINDEIILELCTYMKELDLLEENGNEKRYEEKTSEVDLGYFEDMEEKNIIESLDYNEFDYKGNFYDHILLLTNEMYLEYEDRISVIEILDDINNRIYEYYGDYLKDRYQNAKDREKDFTQLYNMVKFESEIENYINLQRILKKIIFSKGVLGGSVKVRNLQRKPIIRIKLSDNNFNELLDTYTNLSLDRGMISYDWHNLSSGQNAYLDMISRIYILNRNKEIKESIKDVILLIDEGDLYLHPSAQVEFIYNLIEFINTILKDMRIHIILTSNSPFIISDVTNDNVIYINEVNGQVEIDKKKNELLTFGANVNELLMDTFYMEKGTKGMYSTNKINKIKDILKLEDDTFKKEVREGRISLSNIRNIIDSIGEHVVRDRLLDLYKKKEKVINNSEINIEVEDLFDKFNNLDIHNKRTFIERIIKNLK